MILLHLERICHIRTNEQISIDEKERVKEGVQSFARIISDPLHQIKTEHYVHIKRLEQLKKSPLCEGNVRLSAMSRTSLTATRT